MDNQSKKDYYEKYDKQFECSGFGTKAIHSGQEPDLLNGCMSVPICLSSTYKQNEPSNPVGFYDYSRCGNPTRGNLERLFSALENGKFSIAFSSGCAATTCISLLCKTGDRVISIDDVYGGTQRIFRKILNPQAGIEYDFIENMDNIKSILKPETKLIWVESPTNPTLKITDMQELICNVKSYNKDIIIACDNTFLTPYNYKPLDFGVDIVVESATKYLGGHSDLVMGLISTNNKELYDNLFMISKSIGGCPSPFDCWLLIRGIKTLHLRVERINQNALLIARFLEKTQKIKKVIYAGLENNEFHEISKKNGYKGNGGMISVYLNSDYSGVKRFFNNLSIFTLAESLGAVESLVEHPETMTHASVPKEKREVLGITENFIRISIGCEDVEDLQKDLEFALSQV